MTTDSADILREAKDKQGRYMRAFRRLEREAQDFKSLSPLELLSEDVKTRLEQAASLIRDYISNGDILQELTEVVERSQAESIASTVEDDLADMRKLEKTLFRLHSIKEGYSGSLGMKRLVKQLANTEVITGPGCQEDVTSLRNYVKGFGPTILPLACSELQDLYDDLCDQATDVLKRSDQQLLATIAATPVMYTKHTSVPPPRPPTLALKLPSFHGDLLNWRDFWALFDSRLKKEPGLTDADKGCLLVEAMADSKARQRAEAALAHTDCFERAVQALKKYYEDDRLLFTHHFDELSQQDTIKDSVEDLDRLEDRLRSAVRGMSASSGYTAGQMVVAIAEKSLSSGLVCQWRQYIHEETRLPSLELFYSFLDRQRKSAPDHRLSSLKPSKPNGAVPNKRVVLKMQESRCNLDQHRDKCPFCELTHGIFSCTELRDLSVTARLDQVRQRENCVLTAWARNIQSTNALARNCAKGAKRSITPCYTGMLLLL